MKLFWRETSVNVHKATQGYFTYITVGPPTGACMFTLKLGLTYLNHIFDGPRGRKAARRYAQRHANATEIVYDLETYKP